MKLEWQGDARFQRCIAEDGFDLRVGRMFDRSSYGWLVYRGEERCGGGESRVFVVAQAQAEQLVELHRQEPGFSAVTRAAEGSERQNRVPR